MSKIIHHTANNREFLLVEVLNALYSIHENVLNLDIPHLVWSDNPPEPSHDEWETVEIELPTGSYKILFLADEATEEQAMEVVDSSPYSPVCYKNYGQSDVDHFYAFDSLASLICNYFPSTPNRILILEKIN